MESSLEYADLFQQVDVMINTFDSEGPGPLRKGEQPFSWAQVEKLALPLAEQQPDLRVAIWLLRAGVFRSGVSGLANGLGRIAAWMQLPPEQVQPLAEADEPPREQHALVLSWLNTPAFVSAVREAHAWPGVPATVSSLLDGTSIAEALPGGAIAEMQASVLSAQASVNVIDAVLMQEADTAEVSLSLVGDLLARLLERFEVRTAPSGGEETVAASSGATAPASSPKFAIDIKNREQAAQVLDSLVNYFKTQEPGHPGPIFLQRVRRMLGADFSSLMHELYQEADQLVGKIERPLSK